MKTTQYELITKYPSLPSDWKEGMKIGFGDRTMELAPVSAAYTQRWIPINEVKNNSFWKKHEEQISPVLLTEDGIKIYPGEYVYKVTRPTKDKGSKFEKVIINKPVFSDAKIVYYKDKQTAENFVYFFNATFNIWDIMYVTRTFSQGDKNYIEKELFKLFLNDHEKQKEPRGGQCPVCESSLKVPEKAYINLESYKVGGSVVVRTECCDHLINVRMNVSYEHTEYNGIKTEDDWGM